MTLYAVINNGALVNRVMLDAVEDYIGGETGDTLEEFDGANPLHSGVISSRLPPTNRLLIFEFWSLFTPAEKALFYTTKAATAANGDYTLTDLHDTIKLWAGGTLEGDHPIVQGGLFVLSAYGVITAARYTEIGNQVQGLV